MAFYLKYRPQNLDEVLGQEHVKKLLLSAFQSNNLSHAYLFVGPRGTGKTSTARILAKMVNCPGKNPPCNQCDTCISIADGSNLDLIEIDAASNNSVEDIRSLREKVKLVPTSARKKVYIIDEVHMLSTSAFNALLKTLEEPPKHALFILATTEAQKIPATIISRTQRLDFKLASQNDIKMGLKKIVQAEKLQISDSELAEVAKLADGSFRDSVKLLEQLASGYTPPSTKFETVIDLLQLVSGKRPQEALLYVNKIDGDIKGLLGAVLETLRQLFLIKNGLGEQLVKSDMGEDKYKTLEQLSQQYENQDLVKSLDLFQQSLEKFKFTTIPLLPLELAIIEICQLSGFSPQLSDSSQPVISLSETEKQKTDNQILPNNDVNKLLEKWNFVLETVRPYNFSLAALLGSVKIISCNGGVVTLEVPYSFHQRILEAPKSKDLLQSVFSDVLEKAAVISVILGERSIRTEDVANVEVAEDDEIVRMASEIFNGTIVD